MLPSFSVAATTVCEKWLLEIHPVPHAAASDADYLDASVVAGFFVKADAESVVVIHIDLSSQFSVLSPKLAARSSQP